LKWRSCAKGGGCFGLFVGFFDDGPGPLLLLGTHQDRLIPGIIAKDFLHLHRQVRQPNGRHARRMGEPHLHRIKPSHLHRLVGHALLRGERRKGQRLIATADAQGQQHQQCGQS